VYERNSWINIECDSIIAGNSITIFRSGEGVLTLCGVKVISDEPLPTI